MKKNYYLKCLTVMVVTIAFTACTESLSENNGMGKNITLPSGVNVMNENLANARSCTGSDLLAPAIQTSPVNGSNKPVYLRYTTTPGIQSKQTGQVATRGTSITSNNFYDSYCLYTYQYQNIDTWAAVATSTSATYSDEQVYKARNWSTADFWPGDGAKCAFFAYAPYHATGISAFTNTGWPSFHYTVPANATNQNDLLVTRNDISTGIGDYGNIDVPGDFNKKDTITFDHACTAIRFAIGKQMAPGTIKKIEIQNIYGEGDYQYQSENWTNLSTLSTCSLIKDFTVMATDSNVILNNDNDVFMVLPQRVPANATIAVTINDGQEHILKARIDNHIWLKGYTVTYYLSTSEVNTNYVLSVSPASTSFTSSGGNDVLTINSYKQTYYGSQVAIPWTATYTYDENGIKGSTIYNSTNAVVTGFAASGNGSVSGEKVNFSVTSGSTVSPQYRSITANSTHTKTLREAADGSCDLANGKQTANCYVIHAPGHYSLPLVYGNALNGDKTYNTDSYNSSSFVDHQGKQITSPYIYETNGGANIPYDACIVWQDAPQLITPSSLKLSSDNHSIEFDVERNNICQGNSVIALRDKDGNIMWSWHIWVTDYALTKTYVGTNSQGATGKLTNYFMEVPLGWCDADVRVGDELRRFHITVRQTESSSEAGNVSLPQYSGSYTYGANAPYYQWGRKDPILPSDGVSTDKPYYDNQCAMFARQYGLVNTNMTILHPNIYYYTDGDWSSTHNIDYWNRGNSVSSYNNNIVHKTIYSSSPCGYVEPSPAAAQSGISFTTLGMRDVFYNRVNTTYGGTLYWAICIYCSAGPGGTNTGYGVYPAGQANNRAYSFPMRPVLE